MTNFVERAVLIVDGGTYQKDAHALGKIDFKDQSILKLINDVNLPKIDRCQNAENCIWTPKIQTIFWE